MTGFAAALLHFGLGLYHEITSATAALALALTLNGYDIKENWRKFLIFALAAGAASAVFYYFPQALRVVSLVIMYLSVIRFYLDFTIEKVLVTVFTLHFIFVVGKLAFTLASIFGLGIPQYHYFDFPLVNLLFPLSYNIPLVILTCISYRRRWRILQGNGQLSIPLKLTLPLYIQAVILTILLCELLFSKFEPSIQISAALVYTLFLLLTSTLLSFFLILRILQVAEQEAAVAAREQMAAEMRARADTVRAQRHDFVNHVQVMLALFKEGRKEELARYVEGIKQGL